MNDNIDQHDQALDAAFRITDRIVRLITTIVSLGFLLIFGLAVVYIWLVVNPNQDASAGMAVGKIEALMTSTWSNMLPIAGSVLKLVGPILVLFLSLAFLGVLARKGGSPLNFERITSDLPSLLATIIIVTICLLPMGGIEVPGVLNNIALVVVGFYFGKRDRDPAVESPR